MIQYPALEYLEARRVVDALTTEIQARGKAGVIAVCDAHGELIALARMDGAPLSSITIAINKAYSAARGSLVKTLAKRHAIPKKDSTSATSGTRISRDGEAAFRSGPKAKS